MVMHKTRACLQKLRLREDPRGQALELAPGLPLRQPFLKHGGLVVLFTTTIIEKCQTTDFQFSYLLLCARPIILEVG
jgi:hypothetical protein